LLAASTFAFAGEQILEFKFVIKLLDPKVLEAANIDGQTMIASKGFGVAYFKDGRVAINDFIITYDLLKGSGPSRVHVRGRLLNYFEHHRRAQGGSVARRLYDRIGHRRICQRHRDGQLRECPDEVQRRLPVIGFLGFGSV
jgi:hypothetical protein